MLGNFSMVPACLDLTSFSNTFPLLAFLSLSLFVCLGLPLSLPVSLYLFIFVSESSF